MKHTILLFFCMLCLGNIPAHGQVNERIYLQTDKQLYLAGELLWLKMYTTNTQGRLMDYSKIGYVELIHDSIPEVQIKIDIQDGMGAGWMELPALLPTGYYRMIAYTRYMRNEDENVFFEKKIAIINPFHQNYVLYSDETNTPFSIQSVENKNVSIELSLDKPTYSSRNKGELRIKGLPAENISLGISIAGVDPALDVLPFTIDQWKGQLGVTNTPLSGRPFLPEYEGAIIDGIIIDLETGKPAVSPQAIPLLSFPGNEIQLFAGQGDGSGNVSFYSQCVTGKHELATTTIATSSKKYRIDIQPPYAIHTPVNLPLFKPDSTWQDYLQLRNLSVQVAHAYIADSLSKIKEITSCTDLIPQTRYKLDDWKRFPTMRELFIEFIALAFIRQTNEGSRIFMMNEDLINNSTNILVLLDNIPVVNHELMINYNPLLVKTIDMHFGQYIFGGHRFDGIIAFYSYKNDYPGISFDVNTQIFDYEGTQPYRFFYAPNYDAKNVSSPIPDFRHTLLWKPDVQTNGQNTVVVPFMTSDLSGEFQIIVEGLTKNGQPLRGEMRFGVNTTMTPKAAKPSTPVTATQTIPEPAKPSTPVTATQTIPEPAKPTTPVTATQTIPEPAKPSTPVTATQTTPEPVKPSTPVTATQTIPEPAKPTTPVTSIQDTTSRQISPAMPLTTPPSVSAKDEIIAKIKIEAGQRLTLIAEKYYGHKVFWVYLYEYNKSKIGSNPNRVLPGMEILVPAKEIYGIDANNPASVEKATALERSIMGRN